MGQVKEYRRVCNRCQHEWYLPKKLAEERAPGGMEMAGAKMRSSGANMSLVSFKRSARQLKVMQLEERAARVAENSRCPACGSSSFEQQKMW